MVERLGCRFKTSHGQTFCKQSHQGVHLGLDTEFVVVIADIWDKGFL